MGLVCSLCFRLYLQQQQTFQDKKLVEKKRKHLILALVAAPAIPVGFNYKICQHYLRILVKKIRIGKNKK